ncbi:MAG: hypothetical protein Q6361_07920 [Candidatus Hermodarchaeota archaeon]|nr:hypothetical protein [Candidatus Hermodarchaeota archaeon]
MDEWHITLKSSKRILKDVLHKTGSMLIRPRFINELKGISTTHRVNFQVQSPEGISKLPSSFFVVKLDVVENSTRRVTGLFEYAYGAIRIVAIDDEELATKDGDTIIAFFEAPLHDNAASKVHIYESQAGL